MAIVVCLFEGAISAPFPRGLCDYTVQPPADWHYGLMENWTIQRVVAVLPTEGADYEAAYLLRISYGEEQAQVVVERDGSVRVAAGPLSAERVPRRQTAPYAPQRGRRRGNR